MTATFIAWGVAAAVIIALAIVLGVVITGQPLGLLIDRLGRYSLSHTQLALWTVTILSLIAGVFIGQWIAGAAPLSFDIPAAVLGVLGISVGSTVLASSQKALNASRRATSVAASAPVNGWRPSITQIFLAEQGPYADQVIDIAKFQNFIITIVVVLAYISIAVNALNAAKTPANFTALPGFSGTLLVLLGISHAGYLAGKLPTPTGTTSTLNAGGRSAIASALAATAGRKPKAAGRIWKRAAMVYDDGSTPPESIPAGSPLIVRASHPFILATATQTGPAAERRQADIRASQVAADQWAAVLPIAGNPELGGTLHLQIRDDHDALGPGPVVGIAGAPVTEIRLVPVV